MGSSALSAIRLRMAHVPAPAERPPVPPVGPDRKIDVDGLKPAVQSRRRHPLLRGALTGLVYTQPSGMESTTCEGSAWCVSSPSVQRLDVGRRGVRTDPRGVCAHSRLQYSPPPHESGSVRPLMQTPPAEGQWMEQVCCALAGPGARANSGGVCVFWDPLGVCSTEQTRTPSPGR